MTVAHLQDKAPIYYHTLYYIEPTGTKDCGVFLMNDCGTALHETEQVERMSFIKFCLQFQTFWNETILLSDTIFHGDILPHNFVYNENLGKLILIDLDEGT